MARTFSASDMTKSCGELVRKSEERLPGSVGLRLVQSLERHVKQQCVIGPERDRLAPMGIKERLVIEAHERANQFAERGVGVRLYQTLHSAEECRELVGRKCQLRNNAKAAAADGFSVLS